MSGVNKDRNLLIAAWGVLGFALIIGSAVFRLTPRALIPLRDELLTSWWLWALYLGSIVVNVYVEGYRAFHKATSPRVVARAMYLAKNPRPVFVLFAPIFCMGLFYATKKRLIVNYCVYVGIITLIILVRMISQPYRGIVDAGVVVALSVGLLSLFYHFAKAISGETMPVPPDVPSNAP